MHVRTSVIALVLLAVLVLGAFFLLQTRDTTDEASSAYRLNEFGVEITVPSILREMTYQAREEQFGTTLHMRSSDTEDASGNACELGVFFTIPKDDIPPGTSWTRTRLEGASGEIDGAPAQVKIFTNFYLVFEPSQAVCARSEREAERERRERTALWQAVTSARFIQF